jgi:FAD:protein FMN transferase
MRIKFIPSRLVTVGLLLTLLYGCDKPPSPREDKESFVAMGTLVEIDLYGVKVSERPKILELAHKDFDYLDYALHAWRAGSLGRVNQMMSAAGEFSANPVVIPILQQAQSLSRQSDGLFNPAIGHLIQLWGFQSEVLPKGPPPDDAAIKELLAQQPSMQNFVIKGVRIANSNPHVRIDLGAIGKGYAVEKVAEHLRTLGVNNALIGAAGDIKAIGAHGDRPWKIGIQHPRNKTAFASVELQNNEAISTSGDYERFYDYAGKRYHHIIDPRSGYPAEHTASVTVIHSNAATADAAATALFVAGPELWPKIAKQMGIETVLLIDTQGQILLSPAMRDRIHFETASVPALQVVKLP